MGFIVKHEARVREGRPGVLNSTTPLTSLWLKGCYIQNISHSVHTAYAGHNIESAWQDRRGVVTAGDQTEAIEIQKKIQSQGNGQGALFSNKKSVRRERGRKSTSQKQTSILSFLCCRSTGRSDRLALRRLSACSGLAKSHSYWLRCTLNSEICLSAPRLPNCHRCQRQTK